MKRSAFTFVAAALICGLFLLCGAPPGDMLLAVPAVALADASRVEFPLQTRLAPVTSVNKELRTVELVWTVGARVKRYDFWNDQEFFEELSLAPGHVRMERLRSGAPLLNTHGRYSLEDVLGVVEKADVDGKQGTATVRFSERDDVAPILRDVIDGIIRNVSVGYKIHKVEKTRDEATGLPVLRAIDWEPMEISLVPIGADAGAGVRSEGQQARYACEIIDRTVSVIPTKERSMTEEQRLAAEAEAATRGEQERAAVTAAAKAERDRVNAVRSLCATHKLDRTVEDGYINGGQTLDAIRADVLEKLAARSETNTTRSSADIVVIGDERLQRRALMAEAIFHRVTPSATLSEGARQYRHMSLMRLAEDVLVQEGVSVRGMSRLELATRSMMSTSDFANILADVANKRLRQAYEENTPSYSRWARRAANAPDFKNINAMVLSATPALLSVAEGGEFKYGSLSDGKETYAIATYGRRIAISRQAIVNDDLSALDRIPRAFSGSARRLENYTVYQQLLSNPTMADAVALFHATHGNLPAAAAISATSLGLARALMRKQTGLQSEKLNLAPKFLLCGADKEQEAYQYTSSQFVPAKASDVNEFRAGGRTMLEPIVDNEVDGNKWFLAADNAQVDTVEYCYLDGSEGVFLDSQIGFGIDGIEVKARLDFAAKAVDYRGLVYNSGA